MTKISQVSSLQNVSSNTLTTSQLQKGNEPSIFNDSKSASVSEEPPKYLRPGSFNINEFSHSKRYVNGEMKDIYTDSRGNKYVSISGADLVLLNKVQSGNIFHKASYETSLSMDEYNKLTQNTVYSVDTETLSKTFPQERINKQSLKDYNFEQHPAKYDVGTITVNGEKVLIFKSNVQKYDENNNLAGIETRISLLREGNTLEDRQCLDFKNLDELKNALKDNKYNWGQYKGVEDMMDYSGF